MKVFSLHLIILSALQVQSFISKDSHKSSTFTCTCISRLNAQPKSFRDRAFDKSIHFARAILPIAAIGTITLTSKIANAADEKAYISSLATMYAAKSVLAPTLEYVENQAYDNARSNSQYILNELQLQKNVKNLLQSSIDFSDDMEAIETAQEASARVTNTLIQFDSSVYTCIFIPSDDGTVPPSAVKYRNEAVTFFKSFNKDIEALLRLGNEEQLSAAKAIADKTISELPKFLFKKVGPKILVPDPKQ